VSAVILAVIVIMWAVVLVPMWLRRHDAATESRSVDKFSAAMRVLSRRQPQSGTARYVLMPRRAAATTVHVSGASAPTTPRPAPAPAPRRPRRKASLAVRRRRVLFALLGVALLTMVLAMAGGISWVLQIVIDLFVVAFVVHLRTQARRSAALARDRRRSASRVPGAASPAPAASPLTPAAARYAARLARAAAPAVPAEVVEVIEEPVKVPIEEIAVAEATGTDDASAWEPVPVPPPTYTMKPAAPPRYYPPVVPDSDDVVEGSVGDEAVATPAAAAPVARDDEGQLDEILTHRWAVND